jgi:hypothetical protein
MESIILDAGFHTSAVKFGLAFGMDRTRGLARVGLDDIAEQADALTRIGGKEGRGISACEVRNLVAHTVGDNAAVALLYLVGHDDALDARDDLPQLVHDLVFGVGGQRRAVLDVQAVQLSERVPSKSNTA